MSGAPSLPCGRVNTTPHTRRPRGASSFVVPVLPGPLTRRQIRAAVGGVLFTGSRSNVEPHHYGGEPSAPGTLHDPERDATTLPLIREAIACGVPLLGVCRGPVSYTHLRAHETVLDLVCRLLLEKQNTQQQQHNTTQLSAQLTLLL